MVGKKFNRIRWIGGSDASKFTRSFNGLTFRKWWLQKLTGIRTSYNLENTKVGQYIKAGNYFEPLILDAVGVTRSDHDFSYREPNGFIGINTDATKLPRFAKNFRTPNPTPIKKGVIHEAKTVNMKEMVKRNFANKGNGEIKSVYRHQAKHGLVVIPHIKEVQVHVLFLKDEEYKDWSLVTPEIIEERVTTWTYDRGYFGEAVLQEHRRKLDYLLECYERQVIPSDEEFLGWVGGGASEIFGRTRLPRKMKKRFLSQFKPVDRSLAFAMWKLGLEGLLKFENK